jgi:hypothetical protein
MQTTTPTTAAYKHKLQAFLSMFLCKTSLILSFNFMVAYKAANPGEV